MSSNKNLLAATIKFLLKIISDSIFNSWFILFTRWRYVTKTIPILTSISSTLTIVAPFLLIFLINTPWNRLYCYDVPFEALTFSPLVHIVPLFQGLVSSNTNLINPMFPLIKFLPSLLS